MARARGVIGRDAVVEIRGNAAAAELVERDAWLDFFDAAPAEVRNGLGLSSTRIGGMGLLASAFVPIVELNRAMAVGVEATPTSEELEQAIVWLDAHAATGWALQIPPAAIGAISDRIDRHGLRPSGAAWAKFVQPLPDTKSYLPEGRPHVASVKASEAPVFGAIVQSGFGLPDASAAWMEALVGRPGWTCFLATVDEAPAGAAAMFVSGHAAWSGMAATLRSYRGLGVQSSLIAARLQAAVDQAVTVYTSETARPFVDDDAGFSSFRNQRRGGLPELYSRFNFKRATAGE